MAKKSMIAREKKRERLVAKYAAKRAELKAIINDQEKPIGVDAGYATQLFFVSPESGGLNNMVNYRNADMDAIWAKARVEPDQAARDAMLAEIQDILMTDVVWGPVVEYNTQWAYSDRVKGLQWHADNSVRFFDLSIE